MPFVPIFIGVILLGLLIGAGLSMFAKRNTSHDVVVRVSSPQPTIGPVTPAPTEKPTPEPSFAPETPAPAATAAPEDSPAPVRATPSAKPKAAHPSIAPRASLSPAYASAEPTLAPAARAATQPPVARALVPPLAKTPATAVVTSAPAGADDADSEFAKLAAGVVRQYIAAVARGDVPSAYGALGQSVPDTVDLPEIGVIDGTTRIKHVEARGSNEAAAVNVDMQGHGGLFFGQFTVHKTPSGAAVIVQHTVVKP